MIDYMVIMNAFLMVQNRFFYILIYTLYGPVWHIKINSAIYLCIKANQRSIIPRLSFDFYVCSKKMIEFNKCFSFLFKRYVFKWSIVQSHVLLSAIILKYPSLLLFALSQGPDQANGREQARMNFGTCFNECANGLISSTCWASKLFTRVYSLARPGSGLRRRHAVAIDRGRDRLGRRIWRARRRFQG